MQPERQDIQVASLELSVFNYCSVPYTYLSWVFTYTCGSKCVLTVNAMLVLSFALLTDDKAVTAKNDRTEKNPPKRTGKCYVSQSLSSWHSLTVT